MTFPLVLENVQLSNVWVSLFVPDVKVVKESYQKGKIPFPYWSQVWPAAKALAQAILNNPGYTDGKNVLELGAGLGLPSLVAARNARSVLCTDSEAEAVSITKQSADHAALKNFHAEVLDWKHLSNTHEADVLLLSDVSYNPASFASLLKTIQAFFQKGTTVLLSTPQRLVAKELVVPLMHYCIDQTQAMIAHEANEVAISLLVLQTN